MYESKRKRRVKINKNGVEVYGWFAGYGLEVYETHTGVASYTVAIVETDEDKIELIHVSNITFVP